MLVHIQGRKMEVTPALKSYSLEKASVLSKYLDGNVRVHVTMSVDKKFRQKVEVSVSCKGVHLKGVEETEDMYASIDKVMDKVVRQAKRFKEKLKNHHVIQKLQRPFVDVTNEAAVQEIIKENLGTAVMMTDNEAVFELKKSKKQFLVYWATDGKGVKMAYHRSDGSIGITES